MAIRQWRNGALAADRGWKRRFDEPIPLPRVCLKNTNQPVAEAFVRVQHASARTQRALQMRSCFSPFQNEIPREISMILAQRSVSVAPGMFSAAMAFANEISTQAKAT